MPQNKQISGLLSEVVKPEHPSWAANVKLPSRPGGRLMQPKLFAHLAIPLLLCLVVLPGAKAQPASRGMIGLVSTDGKFLQAHASVGADGSLHASNPHRDEEETWWLISLDQANHKVALANFRNYYFLNRHTGGAGNHRVLTNSHDIIGTAIWTIVSGKDYGLSEDFVAFRAYDGAYMLANSGGDNAAGEPGEVYMEMDPQPGGGNWKGWWRLSEVADRPQPGHDFWNSTAGAIVKVGTTIGGAVAWLVKCVFDGSNCGNVTPAVLPPPSQTAACVIGYGIGLGADRTCSIKTADQCAAAHGVFYEHDDCTKHPDRHPPKGR
jgi:hypothetical protein